MIDFVVFIIKNQAMATPLLDCWRSKNEESNQFLFWAGCLTNNRNFFLAVLEARKSMGKVPADLVSTGSETGVFWPYPHMAERGEGALWGLLRKSTSSIHERSTLMT